MQNKYNKKAREDITFYFNLSLIKLSYFSYTIFVTFFLKILQH